MALGKIKADTLEHSTAGSLDTQYVVQGSSKAWINFDGNSTNIRGSFNVSSQTDVSSGRDQITLTNAMNNAGYSIGYLLGSTNANSTTAATNRLAALITTTVYDLNTVYVSGGTSALGNYEQNLSNVVGDLA